MNFSKKDSLVLLIYAALLCVQFFVIGRLHLSDNAGQTLRLVVILLNAFVVIYAYRDVLAANWHDFAHRKWTKWLIIVGAFAVVYAFLTIIRRIAPAALETTDDNITGIQKLPTYTFILTLIASLIPLISAVTEEIMFRHVLMYKHRGTWRVIMLVLSSVAFGLIHYQALGSLTASIPYIAVALLFCGLYLWQRNIWYNIFAHMLFNGVNVLSAVFAIVFQQFFVS